MDTMQRTVTNHVVKNVRTKHAIVMMAPVWHAYLATMVTYVRRNVKAIAPVTYVNSLLQQRSALGAAKMDSLVKVAIRPAQKTALTGNARKTEGAA